MGARHAAAGSESGKAFPRAEQRVGTIMQTPNRRRGKVRALPPLSPEQPCSAAKASSGSADEPGLRLVGSAVYLFRAGWFILFRKYRPWTSESFENVTGVVLAGGRSSRFGENKALAKLDGKTLIECIVSGLASLFPRLLIVTNQPEEFRFLGIETAEDAVKGLGPHRRHLHGA